MNELKVYFDGEYLTLEQVKTTLNTKNEQYSYICKEIGNSIVNIVSSLKDAQLLSEDIDKLLNYRDALAYEEKRQYKHWEKENAEVTD